MAPERGAEFVVTSPCFAGFCIVWACSDLVQTVPNLSRSDMHLPHCVWRTLALCIPLPSLSLTILLFQLLQWSVGLGRTEHDVRRPIYAWAFWNLLFSSPWPVVGLCANAVYYKRSFPDGAPRAACSARKATLLHSICCSSCLHVPVLSSYLGSLLGCNL